MKLQTMFRTRVGSRRKAGVLGKMRKRSRGMKKDESMRSLRTDISSDASTSFPDPADLESLACPKQNTKEVEEEGQEVYIVKKVPRARAELSTLIRTEEERTPSNEMMMIHELMNSFLCFGAAPLPQLPEVEIEPAIDSHRCIGAQSRNGTILQESVECIYDDSADMARIETVEESVMESTTQTKENSNSAQTTSSGYSLPPLDPKLWPQAPLLFRVAPSSGTEILGIRKDSSKEYLWTPESDTPWWNLLGNDTIREGQVDKGCWILPINDGTEAIGESLVIDFESKLFVGSLLFRLHDAPSLTGSPSSTRKETGFFANNHGIRYQVTIQGKFKKSLQWSNLLSGLRLRRKFRKAPSKWFLWTALKVLQFFAPQLQTNFDGDQPYALSPLGSAPRTVTVNRGETANLLGVDRQEPTTKEESLMGKAYPIKDPLERARARKKEFDHKFKARDRNFCTGVRDTYTFEFLQHLLDYRTSSIDLGSFHHDLNDILGGQPFQVMAEHNGEPLWMFEIWNECILEDAKREPEKRRGTTG